MEFRGTIKGMKPETAKRLFNFDLPEDAKGVTFYRRNGQTFIKAYYPELYKNKSKSSAETNKYMKIINDIGHSHLNDIIRPIWDGPARKQGFYCGFNMFASMNLRLIREGVEKMKIAVGELEEPEVKGINYKDGALRFSVDKGDLELGIGVMNPRNYWFKHIKPRKYDGEVYVRVRSEEAVVFLYCRQGNRYSDSIAIRIKNELPATKLLKYTKVGYGSRIAA